MTDINNIPASFTEQIETGRRLLGFDLGTKTIGLAISDISLIIASPYETIKRTKFSKDCEIIRKIVEEQNIGGFVLGLPLNMDGSAGPRVQSTRAFAKNLVEKIPLPHIFWDERMSTLAVTRTLLDADASRKRRSELVDKMAAAYILQGALDSFHSFETGNDTVF